jgi:hypothetical protein
MVGGGGKPEGRRGRVQFSQAKAGTQEHFHASEERILPKRQRQAKMTARAASSGGASPRASRFEKASFPHSSAGLLPANGVGGGGGGESMIICSRVFRWREELHSSVATSEGDLFKAQPVHLHENIAELVGGGHIWKVRGEIGRAINGQDSADSFA